MHGAEWRMEGEWKGCCGCVLSEWLSDYRGRLAGSAFCLLLAQPSQSSGQDWPASYPTTTKVLLNSTVMGDCLLESSGDSSPPSLQPVAFLFDLFVSFCLRFSCPDLSYFLILSFSYLLFAQTPFFPHCKLSSYLYICTHVILCRGVWPISLVLLFSVLFKFR